MKKSLGGEGEEFHLVTSLLEQPHPASLGKKTDLEERACRAVRRLSFHLPLYTFTTHFFLSFWLPGLCCCTGASLVAGSRSRAGEGGEGSVVVVNQ